MSCAAARCDQIKLKLVEFLPYIYLNPKRETRRG